MGKYVIVTIIGIVLFICLSYEHREVLKEAKLMEKVGKTRIRNGKKETYQWLDTEPDGTIHLGWR